MIHSYNMIYVQAGAFFVGLFSDILTNTKSTNTTICNQFCGCTSGFENQFKNFRKGSGYLNTYMIRIVAIVMLLVSAAGEFQNFK
jgi:hypothetical protein